MKIILSGKNMEIGETIRKQANKKVKKIERYFKSDVIAHVTMSVEGYRQIVEVTIPVDGIVLRAEESTNDMFSTIDNVLEKIEKQILKHKTKLEKRLKDGAFKFESGEFVSAPYVAEPQGKVIKHKRFALKPMTEDEALMQMDLIGHSFFVFLNVDTNEVNVLYKRRDGNYGLIEPDLS